MRISGLLVLAGVTVTLLTVGGCAGSDARGPRSSAVPGQFPRPAAAGDVLAQATVLQKDGEAPQLCLGAVAQSLPPQCDGPPILGWDWATVDQSETQSGVTWGSYAVTGTWGAAAFTVTQPPIPLSLYDPLAQIDPRLDEATPGPTEESTLLRLQDELNAAEYSPATASDWSEMPILSNWTQNGYLWISVIYDDGSIQRFFDDQWGAGVVAVQSALTDAE
ncbi:hypothetical protein [Cryobacterium sp. LW097]|uniref:hypothetical protein n=1 Tax=Cryobacterium sp. LW097 TaxID=1978566 RepID=UPI0012488B08|nr:hypothetical protein [Cryobacterium sp. LW097]